MNRIVMTVCYVISDQSILLGLKKVRLGKGLYNGFGGHVEEGESIDEAAVRELMAECGILALEFEKMGIAWVERVGKSAEIELHLFVCRRFQGQPQESDEMKPHWFLLDQIPYEQMWPTDIYYLPLFLQGKKCAAYFQLSEDGKTFIAKPVLRVMTHLF